MAEAEAEETPAESWARNSLRTALWPPAPKRFSKPAAEAGSETEGMAAEAEDAETPEAEADAEAAETCEADAEAAETEGTAAEAETSPRKMFSTNSTMLRFSCKLLCETEAEADADADAEAIAEAEAADADEAADLIALMTAA